MSLPLYQRQTMTALLQAPGAVVIRDVDGGEAPFLYSSGNYGPGYVTIKGMVGQKRIIEPLTFQLAVKVAEEFPALDFVAGNVSGGVVPGWVLSQALESLLGKEVPFVYIRDTRKKGGHKELVTGIDKNPLIPEGSNGLVVEELVNFAETTCNGAEALRNAGYNVTHAACIMFYGNPVSLKSLEQAKLTMIYHFTLRQLLDVAGLCGTHPPNLTALYRDFLDDPLAWQKKRGLEPVKDGGTR